MTLQLELLAELRAALADHDVRSEVRDQVAALAIDVGEPEATMWVFIGSGARYFSWDRADRQHPVNDVPGAARRIAAEVTARRVQSLPDLSVLEVHDAEAGTSLGPVSRPGSSD